VGGVALWLRTFQIAHAIAAITATANTAPIHLVRDFVSALIEHPNSDLAVDPVAVAAVVVAVGA
jgi:hypothetical protein